MGINKYLSNWKMEIRSQESDYYAYLEMRKHYQRKYNVKVFRIGKGMFKRLRPQKSIEEFVSFLCRKMRN